MLKQYRDYLTVEESTNMDSRTALAQLSTPAMALFCCEYVARGFKTDEAAQAAGLNVEYARKLLGDSRIMWAIGCLVAERVRQTGIGANLVLQRLGEWMDADPADIIEPTGGFKPVHEWPLIWRRMVESIEYEFDPVRACNIPTKVKWPSRAKVLEMIGKHVDVRAWEKDRDGLPTGITININGIAAEF